jgi:hypothetical protein
MSTIVVVSRGLPLQFMPLGDASSQHPSYAHSMRLQCIAMVLVAASALMTACGSSTPPSLPIGATPSPYSFTGTLTLSGEIALQGRFSDSVTLRHETCEQYVRALAPATTLWVVPTPNDSESIAGHVVGYTAGVPSAPPSTGYKGPGSYTTPSAIVSVLTVDSASFGPGDSASATITVNASGAGTMSFSDLVDTATNAAESGTVQWTCTD